MKTKQKEIVDKTDDMLEVYCNELFSVLPNWHLYSNAVYVCVCVEFD